MARCGCSQAVCGCGLEVDPPLTIRGTGQTTDKWHVGLDLANKDLCNAMQDCVWTSSRACTEVVKCVWASPTSCTEVMKCVCANAGTALACTGGKIGVKVSADPANRIDLGSDGGLYVPAEEPTRPAYGRWEISNVTINPVGWQHPSMVTSADFQTGPGDFVISAGKVRIQRPGVYNVSLVAALEGPAGQGFCFGLWGWEVWSCYQLDGGGQYRLTGTMNRIYGANEAVDWSLGLWGGSPMQIQRASSGSGGGKLSLHRIGAAPATTFPAATPDHQAPPADWSPPEHITGP